MPIGPKWVRAREHGDWCAGLPHVLAIDCEMAVCQKARGSAGSTGSSPGKAMHVSELIRFSAVSGARAPYVCLADRLVKPAHEVSFSGVKSCHALA
jgi:hypothetical protein